MKNRKKFNVGGGGELALF